MFIGILWIRLSPQKIRQTKSMVIMSNKRVYQNCKFHELQGRDSYAWCWPGLVKQTKFETHNISGDLKSITVLICDHGTHNLTKVRSFFCAIAYSVLLGTPRTIVTSSWLNINKTTFRCIIDSVCSLFLFMIYRKKHISSFNYTT